MNESAFARHEFIGKDVIVEGTPLLGVIVDETKHTFIVRSEGHDMKVEKAGKIFAFLDLGKIHRIEGKTIIARPEDRIRMRHE